MHGFVVELASLPKLFERLLRLGELEEHDAQSLVGAGVVGI